MANKDILCYFVVALSLFSKAFAEEWVLVWADEFDDGSNITENWNFEQGCGGKYIYHFNS